MKKIVLGLSFLAFTLISSSMVINEQGVINVADHVSNQQKTVTRKVGSFEGLKAGGAVSIKVVDNDNDGKITITASEDVLEKLKTEVKDNILEIGFNSNFKLYKGSNENKIEITISHRKLREIELSGASNLVANHVIKVEKSTIEISGSSKASVSILANKAYVDVSGSSKLTLIGNVQNLEVDVSGASNFIGEDLKANSVYCDVSGASKVKVWAVNNLQVDASGASSVLYKDSSSVKKDIDISGASSVKSYK